MSKLERVRSRKVLIALHQALAAMRDESGQTLLWVAMTAVLLLGVSAYAVDVGNALLVRKQLQASADAAALAAAQHLSDGTYAAVAAKFVPGGSLGNGYGYTIDTPVVTPVCSTTLAGPPFNDPCTSVSTDPNMITIAETAHVNTFFAGVLGFPKLTVRTVSAAAKGLQPVPFNIAIVLDTTGSMTHTDSNCVLNGRSQTQLACAENAIKTILLGLDPAQDRVALFTFPAMDASTSVDDTNCSGTKPTGEPYTFPDTPGQGATSMANMPYSTFSTQNGHTTTTTVQTTYEIAGFSTNYIASYGATSLTTGSSTTGSALVNSIGAGGSGCAHGLTANNTQNTYFAATIYAAQAALLAEQTAEANQTPPLIVSNAMIILSDGNATATNTGWSDMATGTAASTACPSESWSIVCEGASSTSSTYPSLVDECQQAVDGAQAAIGAGTTVFTIAYGSPTTHVSSTGNSGNCGSDTTSITPCQTMQDMASSPANFYSDGNDQASGNNQGSGCVPSVAANSSVTDLQTIAQKIVVQLEEVRLIAPNTP